MLIARSISKSYGPALILSGVCVTVGPGHRIGLLGPNGVGKSTLLAILAGLEPPDEGSVERSPGSLAVGYLAQEPDARPGETLLDYLGRRTGVTAMEAEAERHLARVATDPAAVDAYLAALARFRALGGSDLAARVERVCGEVGLPRSAVGRPVERLSGGQRMRAVLACLLLGRFDVLLLDEPTNDLDDDGLERLERFLDGFAGGVMLVSHDRAFMDRTVRRLVEIDPFTRQASTYEGSWSAYAAERERRRTRASEAHDRATAERRRLADAARAVRERSAAGARTARRRPPDNDKNVRAARLAGAEGFAGRAKALERRLSRVEVVEKPREPWRLRMDLTSAGRSGDLVVRLDGAVVERGAFRMGPFDLHVRWRDRIAVTGPNGSGKSTLLGTLLGRLRLAGGTRQVGSGVVVGALAQDRRALAGPDALLDAFRRTTGLPESDARTLLAKFDLGADDVLRPVARLSPGERTRAHLAAMMARGTNLVVLDEPTNHLDIPAIEELEEALRRFDGTLAIATHDRTLLASIGITQTVDVTALRRPVSGAPGWPG